MSCRRAFEVDLPAFLAEPGRPEHAGFRAHYALCAECAAEVAAWTELEASLGGVGAAHPEPAALLRFEDGAGGLGAQERARIESHLARCASCRDELASLRAFPFEGTATGSDRSKRGRAPARRSRMGRVRAVVLHPAFAYAVVALLAWPAARSLLEPFTALQPMRAPPELAAREQDIALGDEIARLREERAGSREQEEPRVAAAKSRVEPVAERETPARAELRDVQVAELRARKAEAESAPPAAAQAPAAPTAPAPAERGFAALESAQRRAADLAGIAEKAVVRRSAPLRIELPRELRTEREVLVRVRDAERLRELRERVEPARGADAIEIELPEDWPPGGSYEVELRGASSAGDPARLFRRTFTR